MDISCFLSLYYFTLFFLCFNTNYIPIDCQDAIGSVARSMEAVEVQWQSQKIYPVGSFNHA